MQKQKNPSFVKLLFVLSLFPFYSVFADVASTSAISEKVTGSTVDHSEFNSIVDTLKGFFNENDGNSIGIGDTPTSTLKLDVDGKIGASEYCNEDGTSCSAFADLGGGKFFDGTLATDAVFSGGNVGIGTMSPQSTLHLFTPTVASTRERIMESYIGESPYSMFGIANFTNNSNVFIPLFYGFNNDDNQTGLSFLGLVNQDVHTVDLGALDFNVGKINADSTDPLNATRADLANHNILSIRNNGSQKFTIDASGNVGIGTLNPSVKLEVNGTIKATDINFSGIPTSTTSLSSGDVWSDGGTLKIMP